MPTRCSPGQRRRISCLGQISPSRRSETRKRHTDVQVVAEYIVCARVPMENRLSPYRCLRPERRRFRLSKIAAVFFPLFDIAARGPSPPYTTTPPLFSFTLVYRVCVRLFYIADGLLTTENKYIPKKNRERERKQKRPL